MELSMLEIGKISVEVSRLLPECEVKSVQTDDGWNIRVAYEDIEELYPMYAENLLKVLKDATEIQRPIVTAGLIYESYISDHPFTPEGYEILKELDTPGNEWFEKLLSIRLYSKKFFDIDGANPTLTITANVSGTDLVAVLVFNLAPLMKPRALENDGSKFIEVPPAFLRATEMTKVELFKRAFKNIEDDIEIEDITKNPIPLDIIDKIEEMDKEFKENATKEADMDLEDQFAEVESEFDDEDEYDDDDDWGDNTEGWDDDDDEEEDEDEEENEDGNESEESLEDGVPSEVPILSITGVNSSSILADESYMNSIVNAMGSPIIWAAPIDAHNVLIIPVVEYMEIGEIKAIINNARFGNSDDPYKDFITEHIYKYSKNGGLAIAHEIIEIEDEEEDTIGEAEIASEFRAMKESGEIDNNASSEDTGSET